MAKSAPQSKQCANCGKTGETLVSFSTPGREETKPLCIKCFSARCREMRKQIRSGQFKQRAGDG